MEGGCYLHIGYELMVMLYHPFLGWNNLLVGVPQEALSIIENENWLLVQDDYGITIHAISRRLDQAGVDKQLEERPGKVFLFPDLDQHLYLNLSLGTRTN